MARNWRQNEQSAEVTFEIVEKLGVLGEPSANGWTKEVNVVAWNGGVPKVDIRDWDPEHKRMSKGVRFSDEEAEALGKILTKAFE